MRRVTALLLVTACFVLGPSLDGGEPLPSATNFPDASLDEAEDLGRRIGDAVEELGKVLDTLDSQLQAMREPDWVPLSVSVRLEKVGDAVLDAFKATAAVHAEYLYLLQRMKTHRVPADRIERMRERICRPLEELLHPYSGRFIRAWVAVAKLRHAVDTHLQVDAGTAKTARGELERLIRQLTQVYQVTEPPLVCGPGPAAVLERIEEEQRRLFEALRERFVKFNGGPPQSGLP